MRFHANQHHDTQQHNKKQRRSKEVIVIAHGIMVSFYRVSFCRLLLFLVSSAESHSTECCSGECHFTEYPDGHFAKCYSL
jgi:hypothetical protein